MPSKSFNESKIFLSASALLSNSSFQIIFLFSNSLRKIFIGSIKLFCSENLNFWSSLKNKNPFEFLIAIISLIFAIFFFNPLTILFLKESFFPINKKAIGSFSSNNDSIWFNDIPFIINILFPIFSNFNIVSFE